MKKNIEIQLYFQTSIYTTTTTRTPTTVNSLIVTMKDFQPLKLKMPPNQEMTQSTYQPVFSTSQQMKKLKPHQESNVYSEYLGIDDILKKNRSDFEKLDELMQKLNETGALTKVNVFNITTSTMKIQQKTTPMPPATIKRSKNVTYIRPYEQNDHQKDSKELKVQFVLDCDLKDSMNGDLNVRKPVSTHTQTVPYYSSAPVVKKHTVNYPTIHNVFNQRIPTKYTNQNTVNVKPINYPPTKAAVNKVTTPKAKVKNVYVDPPVVAAISNAFENVYNYFEEALTTNVVDKKPREKRRAVNRRKNKIRMNDGQGRIAIRKRSTAKNRVTVTTDSPKHRYTKSYANGANQKLTTQIQVTSEYTGKEPEEVKQSNDESSDSSYSTSADDYEGDDEYEYDDEREGEDDEDEGMNEDQLGFGESDHL